MNYYHFTPKSLLKNRFNQGVHPALTEWQCFITCFLYMYQTKKSYKFGSILKRTATKLAQLAHTGLGFC